LENGFITFGCLNDFCKVNDGCLALWAQVLRAIPRSRLLLLAPRGQKREHVLARLNQEGIVAPRVEFADKQPRLEYLKLYQRIDLGLDPLPYNGHTTSLDAFWMGVPTLTLLGQTVVGRAGWSQLCNLGLKELAAESPEQYVALAARLAGDLPRLEELRGTLRQRMLRSPLMDANRFARHMEQAYRQMWRRWCQQSRPTEVREPISLRKPPSEPRNETAKISVPQALDMAWKHVQAGQWQQAEKLYLQVLQMDPNQVDALHFLGLIAAQTGRNDLAIDYLKAALRLKPDFAGAHNNLGNVFLIQGKFPEAVASFQQAVCLQPDLAEAHNNLGNILRQQGQLAEAVASLEQALRLQPDYAEAHLNLGNVLKDQGQIAEAIASYERALELVPDFNGAHSNLLFALHCRAVVTLSELAAAHADFDRKYGAPLRSTWKPLGHYPDPERRLRLGFLSPDLHRHPVGYFLIRCLENLDRQQAEAICYSNSADNDDLAARIRAAATTWRDVFGWSDERLAEEIRADRIDILFDLAGHTRGNRLTVFARKPAPIQITWIGYEGTTGLQAMDYILADRYEIPPEAEPYYCERVLRMPDGYVCYDPPSYAPPMSPLPALKQEYVTFASFNNPAKIGLEVVEVWARILHRLPQARLVLKYKGMGDPALAGRFADLFAKHGIDRGRLEFHGWSTHAESLQDYHRIDIALDPFPFSGSATTCDALWMGVPVITCPGETFAGRHSLTHLSNVGLTQTIAHNLDEYVALAVSLADDLPGLAAVRAGLRERMASSPLCDGERFAGKFVQLLRGVWREWCRRQPAERGGSATC
jgi:protein O-GlcNAc transferase